MMFATTNGEEMSVGMEIRLEATRQGIDLQDVAEQAGMKRPYFSRRINDHENFTTGELDRIEKVLGVPGFEFMRRATGTTDQSLAVEAVAL